MAGTPEKMVEYLLETRVDNTSNFDGKNNDFIKRKVMPLKQRKQIFDIN